MVGFARDSALALGLVLTRQLGSEFVAELDVFEAPVSEGGKPCAGADPLLVAKNTRCTLDGFLTSLRGRFFDLRAVLEGSLRNDDEDDARGKELAAESDVVDGGAAALAPAEAATGASGEPAALALVEPTS